MIFQCQISKLRRMLTFLRESPSSDENRLCWGNYLLCLKGQCIALLAACSAYCHASVILSHCGVAIWSDVLLIKQTSDSTCLANYKRSSQILMIALMPSYHQSSNLWALQSAASSWSVPSAVDLSCSNQATAAGSLGKTIQLLLSVCQATHRIWKQWHNAAFTFVLGGKHSPKWSQCKMQTQPFGTVAHLAAVGTLHITTDLTAQSAIVR